MLTQEQFRAECRAKLGKPYIWGAEGPDAYDCSGLAQSLLERLKLDPPGDQTAEGLYRHFSRDGRAKVVTAAECALGDLVFFGSEESIGHVALGWGGGEMFEAGGGGRTTTTVARARKQKAEVRIRPIARRDDLAAVLRPTALRWGGLEELAGLEANPAFGRYDGEPVTRWLPDGRHMQLVQPFAFVRTDGEAWSVPADAIVDGASIPRVFWSLIGGPLEGPYRDASIVHDYYCDMRSRPWLETHRVFYEAMRCSEVPKAKAKVMYYAVYRFGPRWKMESLPSLEDAGFETIPVKGAAPLETPAFDTKRFEADARRIVETDADLEAIEQMADAR